MYDFLSITRAARSADMQSQLPFIPVELGQKNLFKDHEVVREIQRALEAFDSCKFPGDVSDRVAVCMNMAYDSLMKNRGDVGQYVRDGFASAGSFVAYYKGFTKSHNINLKA